MKVMHLIEDEHADHLRMAWKKMMPNIIVLLKKFQSDEEDDISLDISVLEKTLKTEILPGTIVGLTKQLALLNNKVGNKLYSYHTRELRERIEDLIETIIKHLTQMDMKAVAPLVKKLDAQLLKPLISAQAGVSLQLLQSKVNQTAEEKKFHKQNDTFAFIGRPAFVEKPEGSGNFKKTLEIEKLVKIDPFSAQSHYDASMMKIRANTQGNDSVVYMVHLPKGVIKGSGAVPDYLVDLIDKHKVRV